MCSNQSQFNYETLNLRVLDSHLLARSCMVVRGKSYQTEKLQLFTFVDSVISAYHGTNLFPKLNKSLQSLTLKKERGQSFFLREIVCYSNAKIRVLVVILFSLFSCNFKNRLETYFKWLQKSAVYCVSVACVSLEDLVDAPILMFGNQISLWMCLQLSSECSTCYCCRICKLVNYTILWGYLFNPSETGNAFNFQTGVYAFFLLALFDCGTKREGQT